MANLLMSTSKVTLKYTKLEAAENMYLFDVGKLHCENGVIKAGGTIYLPPPDRVEVQNCEFSTNVVYVDKYNLEQVCNAEAYEQSSSLERYCNDLSHFWI